MKTEKTFKSDKITLGACYYPEQWPERLWEDDVKRIVSCGLKFVRCADFSWSIIEPEEGKFDFELFDRFFDLTDKYGLKVILATPTAGPPAYLSEKYPEILNAKKDGTLLHHGMRCNYSYNSEKYREFVKILVEKMITHFKNRKCIVGYQVDNELNCAVDEFYSAADNISFRKFLKNKYKTISALNDAWGTAFWSQKYNDFEQVYLARPTSYNDLCNPHLALDMKRFISESTISFCKFEADIIRKNKRDDQFVTTNGIFTNVDTHEMTNKALDFITYDSYPNNAFDTTFNCGENSLKDRDTSEMLAVARSISPNFGIMEQQAGAGGWESTMKQPAPKPGQMRLWTFQSIAHGADFVNYYRWRTACSGMEIYWHGLNNYDNKNNRRLEELETTRLDVEKIENLAGSRNLSKVAVLRDYDNVWDDGVDKWLEPISKASNRGIFNALEHTHTPFDYFYINDSTEISELSNYDLIFVPHFAILSKRREAVLEEYVKNGGTVVFGARTGLKDEFGRCVMESLPGTASKLSGIRVSDFTLLTNESIPVKFSFNNKEFYAKEFCDILEPLGASTIGKFKTDYFNGKPAVTLNRVGKGKAYYFGTAFSEEIATEFLKSEKKEEPFRDKMILPSECELTVRVKNDVKYFFVLNYMSTSVECKFLKPFTDILSGKELNGSFTLEKFGVMVLCENI